MRQVMKVLYISYDGMTDPLGQSQVIPYLIGLSEKNQITIISCEKKDRFKKNREYIQQLLDHNHINWIPVYYSSLPSILSKQWNITRIKKKAIDFCRKKQPDVVHCRSYMAALIGLFLKKKFNIKFIFDMRGFWADERIDGNIWTKTKYIHRYLYTYFKKKEVDFLCNADYTISLTENAKKEIASWPSLKGKNIPIQVIPCCADLEHFSLRNITAQDRENARAKLNLSEHDFIISYLGSIGTWYMLDEMLDFFAVVMQYYSTAKFLFITMDDKQHIFQKAASKGIPEDKLVICSVERREVPLYLSLSMIAVYFIKPCYSKKASSPTKTAEILGLGIPIITNSGIGDCDELLGNSGAGLLVFSFNTETYTKIIKQFSLLLAADKAKMVDLAHHYFSLDNGVASYQLVYDKITATKIN
jgi:glycosyltransferase involved in cell wall biosynthesis